MLTQQKIEIGAKFATVRWAPETSGENHSAEPRLAEAEIIGFHPRDSAALVEVEGEVILMNRSQVWKHMQMFSRPAQAA